MKNQAIYFNILGVLQLVVGAGGVAGGLAMITDPSGHTIGMSAGMLSHSPFTNFFVPGIFLLLLHGLGNLLGATLSFFQLDRAGVVGIALGIALLIWLIAQVYWIGLNHFLQPLFFGIGIVEIFFSFIAMRISKDRNLGGNLN